MISVLHCVLPYRYGPEFHWTWCVWSRLLRLQRLVKATAREKIAVAHSVNRSESRAWSCCRSRECSRGGKSNAQRFVQEPFAAAVMSRLPIHDIALVAKTDPNAAAKSLRTSIESNQRAKLERSKSPHSECFAVDICRSLHFLARSGGSIFRSTAPARQVPSSRRSPIRRGKQRRYKQNSTIAEQPRSAKDRRNRGHCGCLRQPPDAAAGIGQQPVLDRSGGGVCRSGLHHYRRVHPVYGWRPGQTGCHRQHASAWSRYGQVEMRRAFAALATCSRVPCGRVGLRRLWSMAASAIQRFWQNSGCRW